MIKIEKIKAVEHNFNDCTGPSEVITIGIKTDDLCIIFGEFYFGPGMTDKQANDFEKTEKLINQIVNSTIEDFSKKDDALDWFDINTQLKLKRKL